MDHFISVLNMSGYGIYVWPSYGLVLIILALQLFIPWKRWKRMSKKHVQS